MPFNKDDYTQPPFTNGVMVLTHDECVKVKDKCQEIKDAYPATPSNPEPNVQYVVASYNESNNYTEAINGDTYEVLEKYDPEVNTQGISPESEGGIVPEPEEEPDQETDPEAQPDQEADPTPNEEVTAEEEV